MDFVNREANEHVMRFNWPELKALLNPNSKNTVTETVLSKIIAEKASFGGVEKPDDVNNVEEEPLLFIENNFKSLSLAKSNIESDRELWIIGILSFIKSKQAFKLQKFIDI